VREKDRRKSAQCAGNKSIRTSQQPAYEADQETDTAEASVANVLLQR
jgi:hypothetical protein